MERLALATMIAACAACGDDQAGRADALASDAGSDSWVARADVSGGAVQETAVAELDGLIYVAGGFDSGLGVVDTLRVYDPVADRWLADGPALPTPVHHAHLVAAEGRLWLVGALVGIDFRASGVVWSVDPQTDSTWDTSHTPMPPTSQRGGGVAAVIGTRIYVAGGLRNGSAVADFSAYDVVADTWDTSLPPLGRARDHLVGAAVDGVFYAVGGRDGTRLMSLVTAFDPATGQWSDRRPLPTPRAGCAAGVVDGRIIVAGGEGNPDSASGVFRETEGYDPVADEWTSLAPMTTPRHGMGAAAYDGRLYVPGGAIRQGFSASAVNEAYRP